MSKSKKIEKIEVSSSYHWKTINEKGLYEEVKDNDWTELPDVLRRKINEIIDFLNSQSSNKKVGYIENPVTGTKYKIKIRKTKYGNKGTIVGKISQSSNKKK